MLYTCPMHPQVEQDSPGNCPICGTALEPKNAGSEEENEELSDMTRRFWLSVALSAPMFILSMGHMLPAAPRWLESDVSRWIQFILSTPVGSGPGGRSSSAAGNRSVSVRLTCLPYRHRGRRGVFLQRDGDVVPANFSAFIRRSTAGSGFILNPRPSSPCLCCSDKCSSFARAAAPEAPFARCLISLRRPLSACAKAKRKTCRSIRCRKAIGCAFVRETKCRLTVASSKAEPAWMNR